MVERVMEVAAVRLHLERLADICLAEPAGVAEPLPPPGGLPAGDLRLDGASFRFGRFDPWLLRDQNLRICEGACVAIMGPSGAGKSTLLRVLSGQLPLAAGQLTVGGQRLGPTCAGWFTAAAGTVLQDDALFTGSVSDNLTLFDPCPDAARLHTALQLAQAEPVVASLPAGLSTPLGEGASGLSGGQRQRLLLARAFYRQPRYLFLDEGTAHLDAPAAAAVQQAIAALPATRVVVTHDLQFARQADRVLWLEGGELRDITAATTSMKAAAS
jgi:ATP-binding cassette subfamily B protein RaxB